MLRPSQLERTSSLTLTRALLTPKSKKRNSPSEQNGTNPIIDVSEIPVDFTPLVVFVNRKSGGQKGAFLYEQLVSNLNPHQVFDLAKHKPERILKIFSNVPLFVFFVARLQKPKCSNLKFSIFSKIDISSGLSLLAQEGCDPI